MRKFFLLVFILLFINYSKAAMPIPDSPIEIDQVFIPIDNSGLKINLRKYIKMTPADYRKLTGTKLKLKEILVLKIAQRQMKRHIRNDGTINFNRLQQPFKNPPKIHWGGFFLGFFLLPIGVLIALLIKDDKRKGRVIYSIVGMFAVISIGLFIGMMIAASNAF